MQISVESGEGLERRMTVELPAAELDQEIENRLRRLSRTARLDGFRPGKVPVKLLRNRYLSQVRAEVFAEKVESSFGQAVQREQLRPAFRPRIEPLPDTAGGRYAYQATFEVLPAIGPISVTGSRIERVQAEITEADLDAMVEQLREQRKTWQPVERPAQTGDRLRISFNGALEGGELFDGGAAEDLPLVLGAGHLIPGFEEGLEGVGPGDTRTLALTFPSDYRAEQLAGKPASFEVQVLEVAEPRVPELNADLATSFGIASGDLEAFRQDIRKNMVRELKQRLEAQVKAQALNVLLATHPLELPKVLVDLEIDSLRNQFREHMGGKGPEVARERFEPEARRRVGLGLLVAEVVRQNGIQVDPTRLNETLTELASAYEDPQEVIQFYLHDREQRAVLENLVLEGQVVDWILGQAQVEEVHKSFREVTQPSTAPDQQPDAPGSGA